jgi:hypothetical protein
MIVMQVTIGVLAVRLAGLKEVLKPRFGGDNRLMRITPVAWERGRDMSRTLQGRDHQSRGCMETG